MTSSAVFFHGASSSSASSPPLTHPWDYHVFLSFRGEDTRNTFTAHLSYALNREGINTYIDYELKRGEEISPALLKAIEGSRISIVVFSKNYADSRWCLVELTKILECKKNRQQTILPVFYHVDPSDVRNQRNSFGEAFAKLKDRFMDDKKKVEGWEAALKDVADLSGYRLSDGNEAEFIYKIVQDVSRIVNTTPLHVTEHPVGIDTRVQDIMNYHLCVGMEDVRIVGIVGTGGIGKSTIAKAIYNSIAHEFIGRCFLANVRERSKGEGGLVQLQEELLSEILGNSKSFNVRNVDKGMNVIKDRLSSRKVLLILDDVDCSDQLKKMAGGRDWFGPGSRIIITTRDQSVSPDVDLMYKMKELDKMEALQLFCWHAFERDEPIADYGDLTEDIIHYAEGLPLALRVLGSDLKHRRSVDEWKSTLEQIKKVPCAKIQDILRISYDGLEENEKDIFLDIACFFKGEKKDYIKEMLDACGFSSVIGISKLVEKCLITIDDEQRVGMHDLVQDMGKEVVRQESPKHPERRSRLWLHEDVCKILGGNVGTDKIEGIKLSPSLGEDIITLHPKAFEKMKKLRLFISHGARFRGKPLKYLPNELRVLVWDNYPSQVLPPKFVRNQLRVFRMHNSFIQKLGGGEFKKLTRMELTGCNELREISDLSSSSNLKELDILDCPKLVKVHKSVGSLGNLVSLMFWRCCELRSFPKSLKLRSLKQLFISNCKRLKDFPEIECEMENVTTLSLHSTGINKLPSSIANLSRLKHFYLKECKPSALSLPRSIFQIKALEIFYLNDCPKAVLFGKNVGHNGQNTAPIMFSDFARNVLEDLNLNGSGLSQPDLFSILFDCSDHGLKKLYLRGMNIDMLPSDMARFVRLTRLDLDDCKNLREIPELPQNIKEISARGCRSLERFSQLPKILWQFNESGLQDLKEVDVTGCHNLVCDVPKTSMFQGYPAGNGIAFMAAFPGSKKPDSLHPCEKNSGVFEIDIDALRNLDKNIRGIALYVVFGTTYGKDVIVVEYGRKPLWSHGTRLCYDSRDSMTSNHVLLLYISAIDREGIQTILLYDSDLRVIEYCGFYPVYENDEEEAAKDKSKMLYEGVDSNLESRWERKRKNSSTFGTQISSLEDGNDDAREEFDSKV